MKKRAACVTLLWIGMGAAAVGFGLAARGDVAAMNDAAAEIREQTAILEEVRAEKRKFAEKLEETAKALREAADSTGARGRALLDMSFIAGKEQTLIDQKQWRAEKRLTFQMARRRAAKTRVAKWGVGLAVTELVLLGAAFAVARLAGRGTTA